MSEIYRGVITNIKKEVMNDGVTSSYAITTLSIHLSFQVKRINLDFKQKMQICCLMMVTTLL